MGDFYKSAPLLVVIIFAAVLSYLNFENREYSWDMPGYLGGIFKTDSPENKTGIHQNVYRSIEKEATSDEMNIIKGITYDNKATSVFYDSSDAFYEQIPYYQIKHSYNAMIYVFYHYFGFSPPLAVLIPNVMFYFLFGILLYLTFNQLFLKKKWLSVSITAAVLLFPTSRNLSEIASPDMMTLFLMLLFLYSIIKKFPITLHFFILLNILLVRPDYIIFILSYWCMIFILDWIKEKRFNYAVVLFSILTFAIYYGILKLYDYPGWKDVFYDSFLRRRPFISKESSDFTFAEYWGVFIKNIINFKKVTLSAIVFLGVILYFSKDVWIRCFAVLVFINIYLKFIFFPNAGEWRFFFPFLLMLFIWMMHALQSKFIKQKNTPQ